MKKILSRFLLSTLVCLLVFGLGYTIFSDTITVGTATVADSLDIDVMSISILNNNGSGLSNTMSISENKNIITLNVPKLEYPGANVTFRISLKNNGVLDGVVKKISTNNSNEDIVITYDEIDVNDVIKKGDNDIFTVNVKWDEESTNTKIIDEFDVIIIFEQSTI